MNIVPLTLREANAVVTEYHRHSLPTTGHKWSIGLSHDDQIVGVAIVGRPIARLLNAPDCAEVLRLCVLPTAPKNACSKLYQACWRIWREMGGKRLITYTLQKETGASLRGAGWTMVHALDKQSWDRPNRTRKAQPVYSEPKYRWERNV